MLVRCANRFRAAKLEIGAPQSSGHFRVEIDQCGHPNEARYQKLTKSGSFDNCEITKSEVMSRRRTLFLLAATFSLAAPSMLLTASAAEAQTTGMERRQERRMGRTERRQERRTENAVRSAAQSAVRSGVTETKCIGSAGVGASAVVQHTVEWAARRLVGYPSFGSGAFAIVPDE